MKGVMVALLHCMQDRSVTMNSSYIELQLTTKSIKVIKFVNSPAVDILGNGSAPYYGIIDVFIK